VRALKLNPWFEDYMGEAMKPLGVYINFFQPTLAAGKARAFHVMMVNDLYTPEKGELRLTLDGEDGREVARAAKPFAIAPLGTLSHDLDLTAPSEPGRYLLEATAVTEAGARTVSRRKVTVGERSSAPPGSPLTLPASAVRIDADEVPHDPRGCP
jgi:hypothetical protein